MAVKEQDRLRSLQHKRDWEDQQNATTPDRGYGPDADAQKPPEDFDPTGGDWTRPNPAPAQEVGPHLDDPEIRKLKDAQQRRFEAIQKKGGA